MCAQCRLRVVGLFTAASQRSGDVNRYCWGAELWVLFNSSWLLWRGEPIITTTNDLTPLTPTMCSKPNHRERHMRGVAPLCLLTGNQESSVSDELYRWIGLNTYIEVQRMMLKLYRAHILHILLHLYTWQSPSKFMSPTDSRTSCTQMYTNVKSEVGLIKMVFIQSTKILSLWNPCSCFILPVKMMQPPGHRKLLAGYIRESEQEWQTVFWHRELVV